jgi:hypothetical protein
MSMTVQKLLFAGVALGALMGAAQAASITVESVTGTWSNITGSPTNLNFSMAGSQVNWGTPAEFFGGQSGYRFVGTSPPRQSYRW